MIKKLKSWLYSIKVDKCLHFIAGIIAAQATFALAEFALPLGWCILLALITTAIAGGIKEAADVKYGVPSASDFFATMLGGLLGVLFAIAMAIA